MFNLTFLGKFIYSSATYGCLNQFISKFNIDLTTS